MNQLEYVLNNIPNWEQVLTAAPFNLKVSRDGQYLMLKYDQLNSDMSSPIVQSARGIIFKEVNGEYKCVCRPFSKFFNYGEDNAAVIDWSSAIITEKVDGSLMKVWFDDGEWHLSTNGTIDAFKAPVGDQGTTFGELFQEILGSPLNKFFKYWDQDLTYLFEMTSMRSRLVISYPDRIYMLAWINTKDGSEIEIEPAWRRAAKDSWGLWSPRQYDFSSLTEVVTAANLLSKNEEGFVVSDKYGNRIKVKSPEYLIAAHLANNGTLTRGRILEAICNDQVDDLIAYVPYAKQLVNDILEDLNAYASNMTVCWVQMDKPEDRKLFAAEACKYPYSRYLFDKYEGKNVDAWEWLKSQSISRLKKMLGYK
jgi:hypothetical protein